MTAQIKKFWTNYEYAENLNQIAFIAKNLNSSETFSFNEDKLFYPASLIKLFWACQLISQTQNLPQELENHLANMLIHSSDEAGQKIVDFLIPIDEPNMTINDFNIYEKAYTKRQNLEKFWYKYGKNYLKLKASHKTFLHEYSSFDAWIKKSKSPNLINANLMADLWQKIFFNQFEPVLEPQSQIKIFNYLKRQACQKYLKPEQLNYQSSLIACAAPPEGIVFSKAGWLNTTLHDTALISFKEYNWLIICLTDLGEDSGINLIRNFSNFFWENVLICS